MLQLGFDFLELGLQAAPGPYMFEPLLHLASEPSMLAVLQLVGELVDDVLDLEGEAPDLTNEDGYCLIGVLEPLCLPQARLSES